MERGALPSSFTSLYRLVLRATSASVLQEKRAKGNLRRLFRNSFVAAARVIRELQCLNLEPSDKRKELETWMKSFNERMDNTLSLLHTSATSKGLPHKVTKNLARLEYSNQSYKRYYLRGQTNRWNPQLPADSDYYKVKPLTPKERSRKDKLVRQWSFDARAIGALGEVIRMAEARDKLVLGRASPVLPPRL